MSGSKITPNPNEQVDFVEFIRTTAISDKDLLCHEEGLPDGERANARNKFSQLIRSSSESILKLNSSLKSHIEKMEKKYSDETVKKYEEWIQPKTHSKACPKTLELFDTLDMGEERVSNDATKSCAMSHDLLLMPTLTNRKL